MDFWSLLRSTSSSLVKHKMRSFLSILGIIIGVTAVVLTVSVSEGLRSYVFQQYENVGHSLMWVIPEYDSQIDKKFSQLTTKDLPIFDQMDFIIKYSPYVSNSYHLRKDGREGIVEIVGVSPNYGDLRLLQPIGRFITENNMLSLSNVCVISDEIRMKYFYSVIDPIGEAINLNGIRYTVVGYLPPKDSTTKNGLDENLSIYIPFTTMQQRFGTERIDMVIFSVVDETKSSEYKNIIQQQMLGQKRGDFKMRIDSIYENMKNMNLLFDLATAGTALITSVGLIVSGIGIMNVLLMSIAERRWEIGLRKAVGANNKSILIQFLTESLLLCIVGAATGLIFSIAVVELVNYFFKLSIQLSFVAVGISIGFCSLVGIFFGIYPAIKAARLDPLECLEQKA